MIGQNPKAEVAPFSSVDIGIKNISFEDRGRHEQMGKSHAKLRVKKQNRGFPDSSWCDKMNWNCRQNSGEKRKEFWTRRELMPSSQAVKKSH